MMHGQPSVKISHRDLIKESQGKKRYVSFQVQTFLKCWWVECKVFLLPQTILL